MVELRPGISVVIPVYHSQEILPALICRLQPALQTLARPFEVVLVNDGSPDESWKVIEKLAARHPFIVGIDLMRNYGQHNALLAGVRAACFDTVVTMDDDLQHPPEQIHLLLSKLAEGYDVVYGTPSRQTHGLVRNVASTVTKAVLQKRRISAFRVFRTAMREAFAGYESSLVCLDVLLNMGTTRFSSVEVRHDQRACGSSNYSVAALVRLALIMITGFSAVPLHLGSPAYVVRTTHTQATLKAKPVEVVDSMAVL